MGRERAEEGKRGRKTGRGANEAPLFDISYSTFFRSSGGGGDELNYKHGMEEEGGKEGGACSFEWVVKHGAQYIYSQRRLRCSRRGCVS